jgi:hypothetical protein
MNTRNRLRDKWRDQWHAWMAVGHRYLQLIVVGAKAINSERNNSHSVIILVNHWEIKN